MQARYSGGKKCNQEELLKKEQMAWELRLQGKTLAQIVSVVGLSISAISKILKRIRNRALKEMKDQVEGQKIEQSEQLDYMLNQAMEAWEKSKGEKKEEPGDVRFLAEAAGFLDRKRKIWGLDAPHKVDHQGSNNGVINVIETIVRTREEAAAILLENRSAPGAEGIP